MRWLPSFPLKECLINVLTGFSLGLIRRVGEAAVKCISIINGSLWSWRVKKGSWFSVVKDEANLVHERGLNGAVLAGGGGWAPFSACVSNILLFLSVIVESLRAQRCVVYICSPGMWSIFKPARVKSLFFTSSSLQCSQASRSCWGSGGG